MSGYSKFNLVYRLQKWMDSVPGQTFLNYAYSWGASVVILGALFKLTHLPGGNLILFIGMGTEVFVFFLSAFDRPFDKTAEGRELLTHIAEESVAITPAVSSDDWAEKTTKTEKTVPQVAVVPATEAVTLSGNMVQVAAITDGETDLVAAQNNYIDALKSLTETLSKVSEQSVRLTRDSEEMENLNRTLTGICKVYEMQLKGASQQIGTIDQINDQTRKMAQQIEQLNSIYARMIQAMTVNIQATNPRLNTTQE